jgi:flavorubredoxin
MATGASSTTVHEIADGIYRISTPTDVVPGGFTFNQFLIVDDDPLLFHTGLRKTFAPVKEAIARVMPVDKLRYVSFSHVEADESGALNEFLGVAPRAVPLCSGVAAMTSINDLADRPPRTMADGETLSLGRHSIRWHDTPHLPHSWESGLMSETTTGTFFCGDLFTHAGADVPPVTEGDILGPSEQIRAAMNYYSQAQDAAGMVRKLAQLKPRTLAVMHGSSWKGDGSKLLHALANLLEKKQA